MPDKLSDILRQMKETSVRHNPALRKSFDEKFAPKNPITRALLRLDEDVVDEVDDDHIEHIEVVEVHDEVAAEDVPILMRKGKRVRVFGFRGEKEVGEVRANVTGEVHVDD